MSDPVQRPVDEVVLSVAYDRVEALVSHYLGVTAPDLIRSYPSVEVQPAYQMQAELPASDSGGPSGTINTPQLVFSQSAPETRLWLTRPSDETRLLQVQPDYFALNWRRRGDDVKYPGYQTLRAEFVKLIGELMGSVKESVAGQQIAPRQVELTYINIIDPNSLWKSHDEMNQVVSVSLPGPRPEQFSATYSRSLEANGVFIGRIHVSIQPGLRLVPFQGPVINMSVTLRSAPLESRSLEGVLSFLDFAHGELVRSSKSS